MTVFTKIPKYLSPTSVSLFYEDRQEFVLKYLIQDKPPAFPQTQPMSIGSGFDARVKSYLSEKLFGKRPEFEFQKIFEDQVEEHNRDWALENSRYVFEQYVSSGALSDLMLELDQSVEEPRFEFKVEGRIPHQKYVEGIPLLGKPDVYFKTKQGARIVYDWKVNGYCSKSNTSPKKGYVKIRDCGTFKSRTHNQSHKDCTLEYRNGIMVNSSIYLEEVDQTWAAQLAVYSWLLGEKIGDNFIVGIDQIISKGGGVFPELRVASQRCEISNSFQIQLFERISYVWDCIQSGHVFDDIPFEQNIERIQTLETYNEGLQGAEPWLTDMVRER